jgi:hypothetical protein
LMLMRDARANPSKASATTCDPPVTANLAPI